jgi:hypothetical protein
VDRSLGGAVRVVPRPVKKSLSWRVCRESCSTLACKRLTSSRFHRASFRRYPTVATGGRRARLARWPGAGGRGRARRCPLRAPMPVFRRSAAIRWRVRPQSRGRRRVRQGLASDGAAAGHICAVHEPRDPCSRGPSRISWSSVRARLPRPWRAGRRKRQAAQLRQRSRQKRIDRRLCPRAISARSRALR